MVSEKEISVRLATSEDLAFVGRDGSLPQEAVLRKIQQGECFVLIVGGQSAGYLRLEFLWSVLPYIALVQILKGYRGKGYSHVLLNFVEAQLRGQGFDVLYSSSQANEPEPQAWHRHMGFEECGAISGINPGDIGEIFFRKRLSAQ